jgi:hypothetical protein
LPHAGQVLQGGEIRSRGSNLFSGIRGLYSNSYHRFYCSDPLNRIRIQRVTRGFTSDCQTVLSLSHRYVSTSRLVERD